MALPKDVADWAIAAEELRAAKARELELRLKLARKYFPEPAFGTNTAELGKGYKIAGVFDPSYKLDPTLTKSALDAFRAKGDAGAMLADRLVSWKPELRVGEWKKLPPEFVAVFHPALTVTPCVTPSLELREPK